MYLELYIYGGVDGIVFVAQGNFMGAQGSTTAGAMRSNLVSLVNKFLVPQLFDGPPAGLDISIVQRYIGVVDINPEADAFCQCIPLLKILEYALSAKLVEFGYSIALNLGFACEPQHFFHFQFYRQAVGVPARFSRHTETLHRFVPWDHILEDAGKDMVDSGISVSCGGTLVENEFWAGLAGLYALLKYSISFPEFKDLTLNFRKVDFAAYWLEHG